MRPHRVALPHSPSIMAFGVGSFALGMLKPLKDAGARVSTYLTRVYAHFPPSLVGPTFSREQFPNPCSLLRASPVDLVIPMSIDWARAPWSEELLATGAPIFSPVGEGLRLERERDFARRLCREYKIPFPEAHLAANRLEAERILVRRPRPYVIKNPLCSPTSPVHTILCQSVEDTRAWLEQIDYAEGVFLQEYLGHREAGHLALVSAGEVWSLATNQEYKRAFTGGLGIIAGAPLGGVVEKDPEDKYHLARELLHPLRPWFRAVNYHGPVQVTAVRRGRRWYVIEYNIRLGVTSGTMILRLLANPVEALLRTARNAPPDLCFKPDLSFGCSVTLAGYGYPYVQLQGPPLPVEVTEPLDSDVWWNEVAPGPNGKLQGTGHRLADVVGLGATLEEAVTAAYRNVRRLRSLGSYYRTDVGRCLWPPGAD
jgi:phosphoribosylamine-glycine ligase